MNSTIQVQDFLARAAADHGDQAANDQLYGWLEEAYGVLREKPWAWNLRSFQHLTYAAATEALRTPTTPLFTWNEGDSFVTANDSVALGTNMTGRSVQLGSDWYTVLNYGGATPTIVQVDRPIQGSMTDLTVLTFVRDYYAYRTVSVSSVHLDRRKLGRADPRTRDAQFSGPILGASGGRPGCYYDERHGGFLTAPAYPLTVTDPGVGTAFGDGNYFYFATRYDPESGLESPPGPTTTYASQGGKQPTIIYGNPAGNLLEDDTFHLRYYRSNANPTRSRPAMYRIFERVSAAVSFLDTNFATIRHLPPYYDGPYTLVRYYPPPDSTRYAVRLEGSDCWGSRLESTDYLQLGEDLQVQECFRLYVAAVASGLRKADAREYRQGLIAFRAQLSYLLNRSRGAGTADTTIPERYSANSVWGHEDSIDKWPWGSDY